MDANWTDSIYINSNLHKTVLVPCWTVCKLDKWTLFHQPCQVGVALWIRL